MEKLQEKLNALSKLELEMNSAVVHQVERAFDGFFSDKEESEIRKIIAEDKFVDDLEVKIDDLCFSILALQQPLAVDLRYVISVMRIITDMERMGDEAVSFSKRVLYLRTRPPLPISDNFLKMSRHALKMCKNAIQAFTNRDVALAKTVIRDADEVNGFFDVLHNEFMESMLQDKRNVQSGEHLIRAARCVERIADHACNVAEDVIYLVDGHNVKHLLYKEIKEL